MRKVHLVVYIRQCYAHTSSQLTLPPPRVLKSILYVCVFIPVLPLGSSEPFFLLDSIYMCKHTVFVFLFLTYSWWEHREISSVLRDHLEEWDGEGGREAQEGGDMGTYIYTYS